MSVSTISRSKKSNLLYIKCPSARQLSKENIEFALPQDWILESEIGLDPDADYSSSENRKILSSKAITNNTLNKGKTSRKAAPSNSLKKVQKKKRSSCSPLSSRENIEVNGRSKPSLLDSKRLASSKKNIYPIKYDGPKYKYIEKNVYVNVPTPRVHSDEDLPHCDCGNSRRDCSDDDCINRMLMVCCPPSCPATPTCRNSFPREDGPIEPFKTKNRGWGLRAKRNIAANQFVTEYRGQIINSAECDKRRRKNLERGIWDTYLLGLESDLYIDARFMSGLGRFLNHSCEPNTIAQKWQDGPHPRIAVFAKRDIRKGEEITLDYSFSDPRNQFRHECLCGSKMCRGYIDSDKPIDWEAEDIRKSLAYDHCFECGEQGDLLTCGFSHRGFNCHRAFHIQCLGLTLKPPPKTWFMCPSHTCDICNKVSPHVQCLSCVSAWCQRHCPFPISLNTTNKLTSQSQQLNVVYRVCPRCLTDNTHTHLSSFYFGPLLKVTESPDSGQVQEFSLHCTPVMESDQNDSCSDDQSDVATDDINEDHTNLE